MHVYQEVTLRLLGDRLVHLDLKGAPPKISYLEQVGGAQAGHAQMMALTAQWLQLFPLFRQLGANGLLMEFEDTFPYHGELDVLTTAEGYSKDQIKHLVTLARENHLEFIPLVQTFGHMEYCKHLYSVVLFRIKSHYAMLCVQFVLKHERFFELREVSRYPNSICPLHPRKSTSSKFILWRNCCCCACSWDYGTCMAPNGTMPLLQLLIGQMLEQLPDVRWLHLGSDEVWQLGACETCAGNGPPARLFISHLTDLARWLKNSYPHLTPIIWDDMLRTIDLPQLKGTHPSHSSLPELRERESGLGSLVQPMVWHYQTMDDFNLKKGMWDKYAAVFPTVWVASAFKGASAMTQILPPLRFHILNQQAWLRTLEREGPRFSKVQGIALTGWQRFDHFTTLCELMPVAIPSLALCLQTLLDGDFTNEGHVKVSKLLGFGPHPIELDTFPRPRPLPPEPAFPGGVIYQLCHQLANLVGDFHVISHHPSVEGAFTDYLVSHNRTNPLHIDQFLPQARLLSVALEAVNLQLRESLSQVYHSHTVEEWAEVNVLPVLDRIRRLVTDGDQQALFQACVVRKSTDS
ncbi:LAMTOR2 [Cordylochernes scorpioides]|uniref:LAMTOR2 n=1 Tax=Cordylochernes scorpioides TaxID=51811 RepID=A0ABY6KIS0_9ARAC|nr:LAMTOR2 [Cordylochernes scorpioides]